VRFKNTRANLEGLVGNSLDQELMAKKMALAELFLAPN
jgi:hypothetical protein